LQKSLSESCSYRKKIVLAMLMAGHAALLNALDIPNECPDGMFLNQEGLCEGKKFRNRLLHYLLLI